MGVPQARFMSPIAQSRANSWRRHGFYGRDSCPPWGFEWHPLNLDRGPCGADYGHILNLEWDSGHSWADCGHIHWDFFGKGIVY